MRPAVSPPLLILLAILAGCGKQNDMALARRGEVDGDAPVRASARIVIEAPPALVWRVLQDVPRWPDWQPDIRKARVAGPVGLGAVFRWTTGGATIRSRIVLFEPARRLVWIGRLLVFHAIHVWVLTPLANGGTCVTTTESLSGWPIGLLFSSEDLRRADQRWLDALRREAERRNGGTPLRTEVAP